MEQQELAAAVPRRGVTMACSFVREEVPGRRVATPRHDRRHAAVDALDHVRGLRIRLLGDRVLQSAAWKIADQLGWRDTFDAEYVALTQLQADAFVTLDESLAAAVTGLVRVAPIDDLF